MLSEKRIEEMRQACRDQQCHCSDDIINLDTEVEELLEERDELLAETKRLRAVLNEVFAALVRAGPVFGDMATMDLAHAVTALASQCGERRGEG